MSYLSTNTIRCLALPLFAIGGVVALSASPAHAQSFRRAVAVQNPAVGFNGFRTFAPNPIAINLSSRGITPASAQYQQAVRNNIQMTNSVYRLVNAQSPYNRIYNPLITTGYNPFWYGNPYWSGPNYNPYYSGYFPPPYVDPYAYGSGYGFGLGYQNGIYGAPDSAPPPAPPPAPRVVAAVSTLGIPTNDDGTITWPFAFRLMAPDAKARLLDPLAAQLELAAKQASTGKANPNVIRESQQGVDRLYDWLRARRLDLAEGSVRDANAFLGRIDAALRAMARDA